MAGEVAVGSWWRASEYEVLDGFIRPAPAAKFEQFDPWDLYWPGASKRTTEPPPAELANLVRDLRFRVRPGGRQADKLTDRLSLDAEGEREICQWCARFGLLGLYAHRVQMVTFGREWEPGELQRAGITFVQAGGGWDIVEHLLRVAPEEAEKPLPSEWPRTSVLTKGTYLSPYSEEPGLKMGAPVWIDFFPDARSPKELYSAEDFDEDNYPCDFPPPDTEEFWIRYGEHVEDFLYAASVLTDSLDELASSQRLTAEAEYTLTRLTEGTSPVLVRESGGKHQRVWKSPSLLATLALMAQEDLLGTKRLVRCEACGRLVTSSDSRTQFCSAQCRQRLQKRRQRAKAGD